MTLGPRLLHTVFGPCRFRRPTKVQRLPCGEVPAGPQLWVRSAVEIDEFAKVHRSGGGTLAYCPALFEDERDGDDRVVELLALVLDFDAKDGLGDERLIYHDEALRRERLTEAIVRVNHTEKRLGRCTGLVLTGYGFHAIWVFDQPLRIDAENRPHVKTVLRQLAESCGADAQAATLSHYFRIPGTLNGKGPRPREAVVVALRPDARLRFGDAVSAAAVAANEAPTARTKGPGRIARVLVEGASEGSRHSSLVHVAAHASRAGLRGEPLLLHLLAANEKCRPPLPRGEVEKIAEYYSRGETDDTEEEGTLALAPPEPFDVGPVRALGGFVADYLHYAEAQTDAPTVFHVGSVLPVLATALGRRTVLDIAPRRKRITFSTMLTGPSRETRKTTATDMAADIARRAFPERVAPHDSSPEALVDALVEEPALLLALNEAATLFARSASDYGKVLLPLLCTLADAPPVYKRRTRKEKAAIVATEPVLCILAGSNEALLGRHLGPIDVQSGLLPRFLLVFADRRDRDLQRQPRADEAGAARLAESLSALVEAAPEQVYFSHAALSVLAEWGAEATRRTPEDFVALARGSEDVARKAAALLHIARGGTGEISPDDARAAVSIARYGLQSAIWLASRHLADSRNAKLLNQLREHIRRSMPVGISGRQLLRSLHTTRRDFEPLIATLRATGEIDERPVGRAMRFFLRDRRHLNPLSKPREVSPVTPGTPPESNPS